MARCAVKQTQIMIHSITTFQCEVIAKYNTSHSSQKVIPCSHLCIEHFSNSPLAYSHGIEQTVDRQLFFYGQQWLPPFNSPVHTVVVRCPLDGGLMIIDISHGKTRLS